MEPSHFSDILKELRLVYPMKQTPMGSFILKEEDLGIIEAYINTRRFFQDKKAAVVHFKDYVNNQSPKNDEIPEWSTFIRNFGT